MVRPPKQSTRKKHRVQKMLSSKQIVLYCLGLRTHNPGLREVDLEPSPKRGSDKINMLRQGKNITTENKSYRTASIDIRKPCTLKVGLGTPAKNRQDGSLGESLLIVLNLASTTVLQPDQRHTELGTLIRLSNLR